MIPNDRKGPQMTQRYIKNDPKSPRNDSKWFQMAPKCPASVLNSNSNDLFYLILPSLPSSLGLHLLHSFNLRPNDSKWFQMIPNDSKWFQITSKWFLPCLACTCCTHSVCAHMLGLFALAQRVFTCLSLLHSFNLCSRAGASCTQSRFPFLALQVSIGIEPLASSYHYLLSVGAL